MYRSVLWSDVGGNFLWLAFEVEIGGGRPVAGYCISLRGYFEPDKT